MAQRPMRREPMSTANRAGDVGRDLARLKGRSETNIVGDNIRGASSPLGIVKKSKDVGRGK